MELVQDKKFRGMSEPFIVKNSLTIAAIAAMQMIVPALIAMGLLYITLDLYNIPIDQSYHFMAVLVGVLALLLPRPPQTLHHQLMSNSLPIAMGVVARWMLLLGALLAIGYATKFSAHFSRRAIFTWAALGPAFIVVATLALQELMRRHLRDPANVRKTVMVGYTESSRVLTQRLHSTDFGMRIHGFFDDRGHDRLKLDDDMLLLGRLSDLAGYVRAQKIDMIFIALPVRQAARIMELIDQLRDTTASIYYLPDMLVFDLIQARSIAIDGIPALSMCESPFFGYRALAKRAADVLISATALLLAAPLMIAIALLVRLSSPGPVIFRQRRYGLNGEEITVYKFRTMSVIEDGATIEQAQQNDPRTTRVGRFLRRYSLDELPQLINVLAGPMSLVGPRPHAIAHNEAYRKLIKGYMVRQKVKPGITGLAQVNGLRGETRNLEQMEERVRYDLEYLRNWSFGLDIAILWKTLLCVFHDAKAF
jgi:putative colanic acid biosysnthesis UDP-glucose lipid carrier transferase